MFSLGLWLAHHAPEPWPHCRPRDVHAASVRTALQRRTMPHHRAGQFRPWHARMPWPASRTCS